MRLHYFRTHAIRLPLCRCFWRMHADDYQALVCISVVPTPVPGIIADTIDSAKGPKMQGHHLSSQVFQLERVGVYPRIPVGELGCLE